jgi:hypothetical protein
MTAEQKAAQMACLQAVDWAQTKDGRLVDQSDWSAHSWAVQKVYSTAGSMAGLMAVSMAGLMAHLMAG